VKRCAAPKLGIGRAGGLHCTVGDTAGEDRVVNRGHDGGGRRIGHREAVLLPVVKRNLPFADDLRILADVQASAATSGAGCRVTEVP
jgi:hypothetical protein